VYTEIKCHSLLPLDDIVRVVTHPDCLPEVGIILSISLCSLIPKLCSHHNNVPPNPVSSVTHHSIAMLTSQGPVFIVLCTATDGIVNSPELHMPGASSFLPELPATVVPVGSWQV
jgi:hypothetical protein